MKVKQALKDLFSRVKHKGLILNEKCLEIPVAGKSPRKGKGVAIGDDIEPWGVV